MSLSPSHSPSPLLASLLVFTSPRSSGPGTTDGFSLPLSVVFIRVSKGYSCFLEGRSGDGGDGVGGSVFRNVTR